MPKQTEQLKDLSSRLEGYDNFPFMAMYSSFVVEASRLEGYDNGF